MDNIYHTEVTSYPLKRIPKSKCVKLLMPQGLHDVDSFCEEAEESHEVMDPIIGKSQHNQWALTGKCGPPSPFVGECKGPPEGSKELEQSGPHELSKLTSPDSLPRVPH